jgi:hypothetical protein
MTSGFKHTLMEIMDGSPNHAASRWVRTRHHHRGVGQLLSRDFGFGA